MATEQYSIGYEEGFQDGWNAAVDSLSAQQEPVAWGWAIIHSDGTAAYIRARVVDFFGSIQERESFTEEDVKQADREWEGLVPHSIVTLYTSPPAQRKPLGYAGITIWGGDATVTKVFTETEMKFAREPRSLIEAVVGQCLDELAAHNIKENT